MLGNDPFYNRTIRKIVVAFGTIFNDIVVVRQLKDLKFPSLMAQKKNIYQDYLQIQIYLNPF